MRLPSAGREELNTQRVPSSLSESIQGVFVVGGETPHFLVKTQNTPVARGEWGTSLVYLRGDISF